MSERKSSRSTCFKAAPTLRNSRADKHLVIVDLGRKSLHVLQASLVISDDPRGFRGLLRCVLGVAL